MNYPKPKQLIIDVMSIVLGLAVVLPQAAASEQELVGIERSAGYSKLKTVDVNQADKFPRNWWGLLDQADKNDDTYLTEAELQQSFQAHFNTLDRDGNLMLDKQDAPKMPFARSRFLAGLGACNG